MRFFALGWPPDTRRDLSCYMYHPETMLTHSAATTSGRASRITLTLFSFGSLCSNFIWTQSSSHTNASGATAGQSEPHLNRYAYTNSFYSQERHISVFSISHVSCPHSHTSIRCAEDGSNASSTGLAHALSISHISPVQSRSVCASIPIHTPV